MESFAHSASEQEAKSCRYCTSEIHKACFMLLQFARAELEAPEESKRPLRAKEKTPHLSHTLIYSLVYQEQRGWLPSTTRLKSRQVHISDFEYDEDEDIYFYPCPCGDRFQITKEELQDGEDIARCPSCSLLIRVIYDPDDFADEDDEESTFAMTAMADALPEPVAA
ncbi:Diphthamide biosynthesis protein 3 [Mortierella alpina]|nr:Diphthamide biosynthesis protein 3 [Mortierella alpina]